MTLLEQEFIDMGSKYLIFKIRFLRHIEVHAPEAECMAVWENRINARMISMGSN